MTHPARATALAFAALLTISSSHGRGHGWLPSPIKVNQATRIADPKLPGGSVRFALHVSPAHSPAAASLEILSGGSVVALPWTGTLTSDSVHLISWDGRDLLGNWCSTGSYTARIHTPGHPSLDLALDIVRLGVTEIEAQDTPAGDDEFPMVYFRKGSQYNYYATPAIHEYANLAGSGEVSDLDLDSAEPRPAVPVHTGTAEPVMDGANYETATYNYPLAYVEATAPRLELTFGSQGTAADGSPMSAGYPVSGFDLRAVVTSAGYTSSTGPITAGGASVVDLANLPSDVRRTDLELEIRWQYAPTGTSDWENVPGRSRIPLRFYTLLGPPIWMQGAPQWTRYAGPWVEVAEYISTWKDVLGMPSYGPRSLTALFVQGFFGQNGGLEEPIEGVLYDCPSLGGDGGATHYFNDTDWTMGLSRLLNAHANGVFVNCTDNMGATTTMLSMMGVVNMRPVRLGNMSLKAIWGIGASEYTTNLWGGGNHGFSYHHIVTDDDADKVSDTCMQLDEDGTPGSTPGFPGWNHHRKWGGSTWGYNVLSSHNNTNKQLEALPGIY